MTLLNTSRGSRQGQEVQHEAQAHGQHDRSAAGSHFVNVGDAERVISAVAGGAIAFAGLRARSVTGLVGAALGGALLYRGLSGNCPAYSALGYDTADHGAPAPGDYFERGIHVEESMTINRTPWDLYQFWRNFDNLPRFMQHVKFVGVTDDKKSHWVVDGPAGQDVEWDAEIINDEPNALIAWHSLPGATVDNAGSVRFVPGPEGRGTEVRVVIDYIPPAGRFGKLVATVFGKNPTSEIREDLRRFKRLMETGEVPTTDGQPRGTCTKAAS
jgi:uncharacterized membrane protein